MLTEAERHAGSSIAKRDDMVRRCMEETNCTKREGVMVKIVQRNESRQMKFCHHANVRSSPNSGQIVAVPRMSAKCRSKHFAMSALGPQSLSLLSMLLLASWTFAFARAAEVGATLGARSVFSI